MEFKTIKNDSSQIEYLQMPRFLFEIEELSPNAKIAYMFIYDRVRQGRGKESFTTSKGDSFCYYSDEELAQQMKVSTKTAKRAVAELRKAGLLEREKKSFTKVVTLLFAPCQRDKYDSLERDRFDPPKGTDLTLSKGTNMTLSHPYIYKEQISKNNYQENKEKINKKEVEKEKSSERVPDSSKPKKTKKDRVAEETTQTVINHWNAAYGTKYSTKTKGTIKLIASLLDSGYSQEEILKVIDYRAKNRKTQADYRWFVPATVLALKNFDRSYQFMLNEEARYQQINDGFDWHRV